jgi:cob(I)alamin adenosyltransferase
MKLRISTRKGDFGFTNLMSSDLTNLPKVNKNHPKVIANGKLHTFSCSLGVVRSMSNSENLNWIRFFQEKLVLIMGEIACEDNALQKYAEKFDVIDKTVLTFIEEKINLFENSLPKIKGWEIPGSNPIEAHLHFASSIGREAEIELVKLSKLFHVRPLILKVMNRVSDLLFLTALSEV